VSLFFWESNQVGRKEIKKTIFWILNQERNQILSFHQDLIRWNYHTNQYPQEHTYEWDGQKNAYF